MQKTVVAIVGVIMLAGGPASAQRWSTYQTGPIAPSYRIEVPGRNTGRQPSIQRQVDRIDRDIHAGRDSGQLTRREARRLRQENNQIGTLADRYAVGSLSDAEHRELQTRTEVMRSDVNRQRLQRKP